MSKISIENDLLETMFWLYKKPENVFLANNTPFYVIFHEFYVFWGNLVKFDFLGPRSGQKGLSEGSLSDFPKSGF